MKVVGMSLSRLALFSSVTLFAATVGCTKYSRRTAPAPRDASGLPIVDGPSDALNSPDANHERQETADKGSVVETHIDATQTQRAELSSTLELSLQQAFEKSFATALSSNTFSNKSNLVRGLSIVAAKVTAMRLSGVQKTACALTSESAVSELSECLVREVSQSELATVDSVNAALPTSAEKTAYQKAILELGNSGLSALWANILSDVASRLGLVTDVSGVLTELRGAVDLLLLKQARLDMPFIAKSFIEGREFVMTHSFQQASVGNSRVFNLESYLVKFEVNSGRLVVLQDKDGLYNGSAAEDIVVGSYPIVSVRSGAEGELFYQVDFSQPENKRFLLPVIIGAGSKTDLLADVVVPKIAHAPKKTLDNLGSGLYFDKSDETLVVDNLVLVSSSKDVFNDDDSKSAEDPEYKVLGKDNLRPTVRMSIGFFALDESSKEFAKDQQINIVDAKASLGKIGVRDLSGDAEPYFTGSTFMQSHGGRAYTRYKNVRKFNLKKDIAFVLSENTPAKAVPAIESAVLAYKHTFDKLTKAGEATPNIRVYTQAEFEKMNATDGLKLGGKVNAADPRVNMINWDDNLDLGAAWATDVANPKTGEVISGDVMMSGSLWAQVGCLAYMERTWKTKAGSAEVVPSTMTRKLWTLACDGALENLGVFKPESTESAVGAVSSSEVANATSHADADALAQLASQAFGKTFTASDMVVELNSPHSRLLSEAEKTKLKTAASEAIESAYGATSKLSLVNAVQDEVKRLVSGANNSNMRTFSLGGSKIQVQLDCIRQLPMPGADANIFEADSGSPMFTSEFLKSPEDAALAMVKMVVQHELGHVFGLRHNFIASTTPSVLADRPSDAIPVFTRTDSVMDYNDYGIEMDLGAMPNTQDANSAKGRPEFGVYDLLALSNIYGLDTSTLQLKKNTVFCTDDNVQPIGNCQRYDYGNSYTEYNLHQLNLRLVRLREEGLSMDNIALVKRTAQALAPISLSWQIAQDAAAQVDDPMMQMILAAEAYLGYSGRGGQQDFLKNFEKKFGAPVLGIKDVAAIGGKYFQDPATGDLLASLFRSFSSVVFVSTTTQLHDAKDGDALYMPFVRNLQLPQGISINFQTEMLDTFSSKIVVPKGTVVDCEGLNTNGEPVRGTAVLDADFFNYEKNTAKVKCAINLESQPVMQDAEISGQYGIDDLKIFALSSALVAGGSESSPSVAYLKRQAEVLKTCSDAGTACLGAASEARVASDRVLGALTDLGQKIATISKYKAVVDQYTGN